MNTKPNVKKRSNPTRLANTAHVGRSSSSKQVNQPLHQDPSGDKQPDVNLGYGVSRLVPNTTMVVHQKHSLVVIQGGVHALSSMDVELMGSGDPHTILNESALSREVEI
ncbi:hypothetical protein AAZV13_08G210500 [Glycine max]|nr:hypothetical protein GYH30_022084 [Glycine max]